MVRVLLIAVLMLATAAQARADGLEFARAALEAESRHDFEQAVALYTRAIESGDLAGENLRDALHYRGNARFFLERYEQAAADYERSLKTDPGNIYAALWFYLARQRAGRDGRAALADYASGLDLFYWPGPVVSLYLGEASPEDVVLSAEDPFLDEKSQREQLCEAYFYVGQYHLLGGRAQAARDMFNKAIATGATDFVEYEAAQAELARLSEG